MALRSGISIGPFEILDQTWRRLHGGEQTLPIQGFVSTVNNREYDIFPDSRQLLMVTPAPRQDAGPAPAIHVDTILNWTEELKARVPPGKR
jgi:hypothetical protein